MVLRPGSPLPILLAAALAAACASSTAPPPQAETPRGRVVVLRAEAVGPYLDAAFEAALDGQVERFYFPDEPVCRALLVPGRPLRYERVGSFGRLRDDEGALCTPVGISTLGRWRDLELRRRPVRPPRVLAEYRALPPAGGAATRPAAWLLVRGRFPLALAIRWPEPMDAVAVLPPEPACRAALASGRATLELRADLPRPFWLETDAGRCPIEGFALPPREGRAPTAAETPS